MKVTLERTGGFAGLRMYISVDSESLLAQEAADLEKLVQRADFFNINVRENSQSMPDGFQYVLSVDDTGRQRTLQFTDGSMPEKLQPMVNDLVLRARNQRLSRPGPVVKHE